MRVHHILASIFLAAACAAGTLVACQKAPNNMPAMPPSSADTPTTKPDGVSSVHVAMTALVELSHLERAIKPFTGVALQKEPCRTTRTTNRAQWETTWKCGTDETIRGRTEITGSERLNYDHPSRTLTYDAKFETRTFEDLEPRAQAHTLVTNRKIKIQFNRTSTEEASYGNLVMSSSTSVSRANGKLVPGSHYKTRIQGMLVRLGSDWRLGSDSRMTFDGVLYGRGGERGTAWASGAYTFVPDSSVTLTGLGAVVCTKPVGVWKLSATGAGKKFDTQAESSEAGGVTVDGSTLGWPNAHCDEP